MTSESPNERARQPALEGPVHTWHICFPRGVAVVQTTTDVLLDLAESDRTLIILAGHSPKGDVAPMPTCRICRRRLYFAVGWRHHNEGHNEPFRWVVTSSGRSIWEQADHAAVPVFLPPGGTERRQPPSEVEQEVCLTRGKQQP
ncbi:MAG: hypothetical protein AB1609_20460, partial [Bacillota bacterium]